MTHEKDDHEDGPIVIFINVGKSGVIGPQDLH